MCQNRASLKPISAIRGPLRWETAKAWLWRPSLRTLHVALESVSCGPDGPVPGEEREPRVPRSRARLGQQLRWRVLAPTHGATHGGRIRGSCSRGRRGRIEFLSGGSRFAPSMRSGSPRGSPPHDAHALERRAVVGATRTQRCIGARTPIRESRALCAIQTVGVRTTRPLRDGSRSPRPC